MSVFSTVICGFPFQNEVPCLFGVVGLMRRSTSGKSCKVSVTFLLDGYQNYVLYFSHNYLFPALVLKLDEFVEVVELESFINDETTFL